jgi:hypothetical protein
MTRLDALRQLLATPRAVPDDGKIGTRVIYATSDGRERLIYVFRTLKTVIRRLA